MDKNKMRYLKTYKLFEANWYDIKYHIDVLSDMSMYLWDKEFNVQVADEIISREHQCIVVNIVKKAHPFSIPFTYPEIKEELLEMVGYMDREGWEILNMEFTHIAAGPLYCKLDGDKLVSAVSEEEIDYQFHQLIVKFVEKKEVKKNESSVNESITIRSNWSEIDNKLQREFEFSDFQLALGFINKIALIFESQNHHPEINWVYNKITLKLSTHDAGDVITEKDIKLAELIDEEY
jgi:4a-hydroxytetrahydrobiopterin dehydratase